MGRPKPDFVDNIAAPHGQFGRCRRSDSGRPNNNTTDNKGDEEAENARLDLGDSLTTLKTSSTTSTEIPACSYLSRGYCLRRPPARQIALVTTIASDRVAVAIQEIRRGNCIFNVDRASLPRVSGLLCTKKVVNKTAGATLRTLREEPR